MKSQQIGEMVESAAGPEAWEVVVTWLDEIEMRGETKGRKEGRAEILLGQLAVRFGKVPDEVRAKVQTADEATISRWAMQVLTAPTIEAAVAGRGKPAPARKATARAPVR